MTRQYTPCFMSTCGFYKVTIWKENWHCSFPRVPPTRAATWWIWIWVPIWKEVMETTSKGQLIKIQVNEKLGSACVLREEMTGLSLFSSLRRENNFPIRSWRPWIEDEEGVTNAEIKDDHPKIMNTAYLFRACYSKRVSPHPFGRDLRQAGEVQTKGRLHVCPDWRLLVWGSWSQSKLKRASFVIDLGSIFGLFFLVLSWKQGPKTRKLAVIDQDCFGLVWLPRWVAAEVVGQSSVVIYSLVIVHLYIYCLWGFKSQVPQMTGCVSWELVCLHHHWPVIHTGSWIFPTIGQPMYQSWSLERHQSENCES